MTLIATSGGHDADVLASREDVDCLGIQTPNGEPS